MKEINLGKIFSRLGYVYIMLPFCIFIIGWCKWYVWIPGMIIILACAFGLFKNESINYKVTITKQVIIRLIVIFLIIAAWVLLSGIGKVAYQSYDHIWRNQIFEMLVKYEWPVVTVHNGSSLMLVYYIAFWLPAAIFGKLFGVAAGYIFQVVWAFIGVCVAYMFICIYLKKIKIWPLIIFVFFSGLDILGVPVENKLPPLTWGSHIEWWTQLQYSSFTTQLFWVFNQAIFAWIIFMMIMLQKDNKYKIFTIAFAVLAAPFPFVGMLPFLIYKMIKTNMDENKKVQWKVFFKELFTVPNILGGGFVGMLSFFYLHSNMASNIVGNSTYYASKYFVLHLLIAAFFEYLLYCATIFKTQMKNPLFYVMLGTLFVVPWISVGSSADFCMRASIPALMILYLLVVDTLEKSQKTKKKIAMIVLICLLTIGAVTPFQEFTRAIINSPQKNSMVTEEEVWESLNFIGDREQGLFNKYLSK